MTRDLKDRFRHLRRLPLLSILGCYLMFALQGCSRQAQSFTGAITHPAVAPTISPTTQDRPSIPARSSPDATRPGEAICPSTPLTITVRAAPTYSVGEPVILTVEVTNNSDSPCSVPTGTCIPQVRITNAAGTHIWNRATTQGMCTFGPPHALQAGETTTQTVEWNGHQCQGRTPANCPGTPSPPGAYQVSATWQSHNAATTTFQISP